MKCPLLSTGDLATKPSLITEASDCLQAECAWWSPAGETCSVFRVNNHLAQMVDTLKSIAKELTLLRK